MKTKWIRFNDNSLPKEGERFLASNGETITIVHYVMSENHRNFFFDTPTHKDIEIKWWISLPEFPPKIVEQESKVKEVLVFES